MQPVTASLSKEVYEAAPVIAALQARPGRTVIVDEAPLLAEAGSSKVLNMVLLAAAVETDAIGIALDELKDAVRACVKPRFVDMNIAAIDAAAASVS